MKSITKNSVNNRCIFRSAFASLLLISLLQGCALMGSGSTDSDPVASTENLSNTDAVSDEVKSPELAQAENQVRALEQQLESLKIEWEQQKPALERLVSNEADLEFLVQALADMSQLADEPSRSQYLGQDELTAEKREQSLQALQSLVSTQEELNTLLVDLSTVVSDVAANRQELTGHQSFAQSGSAQQSFGPSAVQNTENSGSEMASTPSADLTAQSPDGGSTTSIQTQSSYTQTSADCNCTDSETSSPANSGPAKARDPSWFAMTTPYAEAAPATSTTPVSQLDSEAVAGQPIPGLQVKTFKRLTLPSELAAAGADLQQYAMAPQFHMSRKSLSDYVSQLAFKLAGNQQLAGNKIGVASFVFFDEQLEKTSAVGNQLAEELSTVLPAYGARVIEYKLTREITVGPTGDLSLSRNTRKLRDSQGMDYVLTGTMVPTRRGLQIHSRVVSTRDNVVIASASTLIPALVLQQL